MARPGIQRLTTQLAAALGLGALVILSITSVNGVQGADKPFGGEEDIAYSEQLWSALEDAKLVGPEAKPDEPYIGIEPHGAVLETLEEELKVGDHTGAVWVKRNYGPKGVSIEAVTENRDKHLKSVTVMYKREAGYDPDNQNWFWVKYTPDGALEKNPKGMSLAGRVAKGADEGCIACHSKAAGGDYLFRND